MDPEAVRKLLSLKTRGSRKSALSLTPAQIPLPAAPKAQRAERERIRRTHAQEHEQERQQQVNEARDARVNQHHNSVYYKTTENVDLVNSALFRGAENARESGDGIAGEIEAVIRALRDHETRARLVHDRSAASASERGADVFRRAFEFAGSISAWKKTMNAAQTLIERCKALEDARMRSTVRARTLVSGMQATSMSCGLFFLSSYNLGPNAQQTVPAEQLMEIEMRGIEEEPMLVDDHIRSMNANAPNDNTMHVKSFRVADATLLRRAIAGTLAHDDSALQKLMAQCVRTAERCLRDGAAMISKLQSAQRQMSETLTAATAETDYISYVHRIVTI